ncbi:hypothetical protein EJ08DRAFT_212946 [Tothia fuscella]|uniref:Uncharacterized protein n=1 Tax=Tothia fuscella TaxID=1048955 RepID=A0A9P4NTB5_9PEZI|nr:hypothetical protein EJ08DRAFT_212946 [Tothia fuscella]
MASRHNRKRTRSRPRNRVATMKARSILSSSSSDLSTFNPPPPLPGLQRTAMHWQQQYNSWQDHLREQHQNQALREKHEAEAAELQRLRIFGGEAGDEVSLCAPMLAVVTGLFNGNLDYEDP